MRGRGARGAAHRVERWPINVSTRELERVTTPSLPALRKYVEGSALADEAGDPERGLALLGEAVTLDTAFAMAWRKIAVLLNNENRDRTRALAATTNAAAAAGGGGEKAAGAARAKVG